MVKSALDTPMMRQYLAAKAEHPDCLLFMRMGDFFELFLDDAKLAASLLGITLTARNKGAADEVPMAGVPHHSLQQHLPKLLEAGHKVAIMDQLEDPKASKGLVKRGLTRIISAGTLIDESILSDDVSRYLVALTDCDLSAQAESNAASAPIGVAALDVSTGRLVVEAASNRQDLALMLARYQPVELVMPERLYDALGAGSQTTAMAAADEQPAAAQLNDLFAGELPALASLPAYAWRADDARRTLHERLGVSTLDGFGISTDDDVLAIAAAAALRYAEQHACQPLTHIRSIERVHGAGHLLLDAACRRNLELLRNSRDGSRRGSLLATIDRTRTAPGARLLAEWLVRPLADQTAISARHDAVEALVNDDDLRCDVREQLSEVYDLERLLTRVATARCHARDLIQLSSTLAAARAVGGYVRAFGLPQLLAEAAPKLDPAPELAARIDAELVAEPPLSINEGGLIRDGIDDELDELREIKRSAGEWLAHYQQREAEQCGIPKIKVGYNKVFGYYLEVSRAHAEKVPEHFQRKQTLVNAERYITPELKEYEDKALNAEDRIRSIELARFQELRDAAAAHLDGIQACAHALAAIDVFASLAEVARSGGWTRPVIDDSVRLDLADGRHPVVESVLGPGRFVANDTDLDGANQRLAVITGPNMAGKSTYIRQVALSIILAQAGAFVPASRAHIGVVDRLFTRVGAGDELARNMSTFMVEMAETAAILHNATERSLVILDEVGRGTSTFDGLSLAWAITEHLHDVAQCRCLFATHYHELTDLAAQRDGVFNLTVAIAETNDEVAFLHRIQAGAATKSYGIHVARLAGVPTTVLERAGSVLSTLDQLNVSLGEREARPDELKASTGRQLDIFTIHESPTLHRLKHIDPDELSPRDAQQLLYELRDAARGE